MKKKPAALLVVVLIVSAAAFLVRSKMKRNEMEGRPAALPVLVDSAVLKNGRVELTRHASVSVEAQDETVVMSRLNAYVTDLELSEGDRFKAGQVLMKLDLSEAKSELQHARANLAQVELQRATLAADLAAAGSRLNAEEEKNRRVNALYKIGGVSLEALQESEASLAASRARFASSSAAMGGYAALLDSSRAAVDAARENLGYGLIRAPFDGVVSRRLVQRGDLVTPGKALLKIIDTRTGQRLLVDTPSDLKPVSLVVAGRSYPLKAWPAAGAEGMMRYEAHAEGGFVPGSRVDGKVVIFAGEGFFLPSGCLFDDDGKSATLLKTKGKRLEPVRVGFSAEGDEGAATNDARLQGSAVVCSSPDILTRLAAGMPFQVR